MASTFIYEDATKRWSPEAGGYVDKKSGSLISKTPAYSAPAPAAPAVKPASSASPSISTSTASTKSSTAPITLQQQQQAQAWLNNPASGFTGGLGGYTASQQERYNQAFASGDTDLVNRLQADAQRVGYNLTAPQPVVPKPVVKAPAPVATPQPAPVAVQPPAPAVPQLAPAVQQLTSTPAPVVSPAAVSEAINKAVAAQPAPAQPVFTPQPQYADPNFINEIVQKLMAVMSPATDITRRNINQSYDLGQQRLMEGLNARGVLYGDIGQGNINLNEQGRQQALMDIDAQTQAQALAQALQFAQLPMQERAQQYGEFSSDRGFNADQLRWQAEMLKSIYDADRGYNLSELQTLLPYQQPTVGQMLPYTMGPTPEALLPYQQPTANQLLPYTMGPTPGELLPYQQATMSQLLPYLMGPTPEAMLPYQQPTAGQMLPYTMGPTPGELLPYQSPTASQMLPYTMGPTPGEMLPYEQATVGQQLNFEQALLPWTQGMTPAEQETVKRLTGQLEEMIRSNMAGEGIQQGRLTEDIRSNRAGELIQGGRLQEDIRSNRAGEALAAAKKELTPKEKLVNQAAERMMNGTATAQDLQVLGIKEADKENIRQTAISMAQKDPAWEFADMTERTQIVSEYIKLLSGGTAPMIEETISDDELLQFLR